MFKRLKNHFETERTVQELSRLTNRELADIGISRADIRHVAKSRAM